MNYEIARAGDEERILDFANMVFSQAHCPHDFSALLPKMYRRDRLFAPAHYVARREDGQIRGLVGIYRETLSVLDTTLSVGCVGTVSAHPYDHGAGHMKGVMALMLEDQRGKGIDLLALGGQRQRYGYFGFEQTMGQPKFRVTRDNVRHALRDADVSGFSFAPMTSGEEYAAALALYNRQTVRAIREESEFPDILKTWSSQARVILKDGAFFGYLTGGKESFLELFLTDESRLLPVLKTYFDQTDAASVELHAPIHMSDRISALCGLSENVKIECGEMIRVFNWRKVLSAYLALQRTIRPVQVGRFVLDIAGEGRFALTVTADGADVCETADAPDFSCAANEAVRRLFHAEGLLAPMKNAPLGWFPLPFCMAATDEF